jgi:hypothetical protein
MRVLDLKAIEYVSARDSRVAFSGGAVRAAYAFPIELFQVEGRLPLPAI